jgi:hypothetical protein
MRLVNNMAVGIVQYLLLLVEKVKSLTHSLTSLTRNAFLQLWPLAIVRRLNLKPPSSKINPSKTYHENHFNRISVSQLWGAV